MAELLIATMAITIPVFAHHSYITIKEKLRLLKIRKQGYRRMKKHNYINGLYVEEREDEGSCEFANREELLKRRKQIVKQLKELKERRKLS